MSDRDIVANRVQATLDGKDLPQPLSIRGLGNIVMYKQHQETADVGGFVVYRPDTVEIEFPITKNSTLRDIGKNKDAMKKDYAMTFRFMADDDKTPLTTTDLTNLRFLCIVQVVGRGTDQPVERVVLKPHTLTHSS